MSLVEADGIALIPRFSEGVEAGEEIQVEIIKSINEIENTLIVTGSHDISLDILASLLSQTGITRLTSSSVGSLGGLMALERGEAHIAGAHLLYPETGEYNIPYICKNVTRPTSVVTLVHRIQGLIISPGNPLGLESLSDLATNRLAFVNRQRGSGTRLLLDHELSRLQIDPFNIEGYRREEYTHLAVAATVAAGKADVGMGIQSAARAFGLDFIPITKERYDLIIPHEHMRDYPIAAALAAINSDDFKDQVDTLGGYDTAETGNVVAQLAGQS
jgi:putative molybdopterin biosynthesis protein